MKDIVKILPNFKKFNDYISNVKNKTNPIMLSGLTDSGKVHFAYSTYFYAEKPICIILAYLMAFITAQSRVDSEVHSVFEVIVGGLLGVLLTLLVFTIFKL